MPILSALLQAWRARQERIRTRRQLRALDDHMLQDIGIRRDQIDFYASTHGART